jgi:hypothetical protein
MVEVIERNFNRTVFQSKKFEVERSDIESCDINVEFKNLEAK